ncbi:hypothetical protein [Thermoactinospora rubra]|uniref:hypothetical protein n=1 Tax=Thermoactinospora rubra TaxID=1088767 RepID=UPI000A0F6A38|nr:hypothetical protein [Thermoactinospora rubra]
MDVWITYRLIKDDDPSGECEAGNAPDQESRRELFTLPDPDTSGFELNGTFISYGPSIGQMLAAIRQRNNCDAVILKTEIVRRQPSG